MAVTPLKTPKMKALEAMAGQMPIANQQVAQGMDAARQITLAQQIGAAPAGQSYRAAQAAGGQQAAASGAIAVDTAQQNVQNATSVGQLGLAEQGRDLRQQAAGSELAEGDRQLRKEQRLNQLGNSVRRQIYDNEIQFKYDQQGNNRWSARQLNDWAVQHSQNAEDYKQYEQLAGQAQAKAKQVMEMAQKKALQYLEQEYLKAEQQNDQKSKLAISQFIREAKAAQARREARAKNNMAAWQAGGAVIGAVAGSFTPLGPAGGAAVGSSLGTMAGSANT